MLGPDIWVVVQFEFRVGIQDLGVFCFAKVRVFGMTLFNCCGRSEVRVSIGTLVPWVLNNSDPLSM